MSPFFFAFCQFVSFSQSYFVLLCFFFLGGGGGGAFMYTEMNCLVGLDVLFI